MPNVSDELIGSADIVCIGSLMLADADCVEYALDVAKRAHGLGKIVAFDVNYRTDIFRDKESAVKTYKKILAVADIVKFSEDEVETFTEEYVDSLTDKLVLITLGKNGSEWRYKGMKNRVPAITVKSVDTTGAGDFYAAGFLAGMCEGLSLRQCGTIGAITAGKVIEIVGTTPTEEAWDDVARLVKRVKAGKLLF